MAALVEKERKAYELEKAKDARVADELSSANDGLRKQLDAVKAKLNSTTPERCARTGAQLAEHVRRGAELASRCAAELDRSQSALKACVSAYEDIRSVHNRPE